MKLKCRERKRIQVLKKGQSFDLFHLGQYLLVLDNVFIGGQQDIELPAAELRHKPTAQSRGALRWDRHKEKTNFKDKSSKCNQNVFFKKVEVKVKMT